MNQSLFQGPYTEEEIRKRIERCPRLGSLRSINQALSNLVNAQQNPTHEIAAVIRKDPTITSRVLRMVNSVFFGLSYKVTNVEDAIFYLGLRQVRELVLATPVIEDFGSAWAKANVNWEGFWQHSIGCAMIGRELISVAEVSSFDDSDYILGLVHDMGKIVSAYAFSEEFKLIVEKPSKDIFQVCDRERELIGWDHAAIGAYYLQKHQLPEDIVEAVKYHNDPESSPSHAKMSAAIQIADVMVRIAGVPGIEEVDEMPEKYWESLESWKILFPEMTPEIQFGIAAIRHSLKRMPAMLQSLTQKETELQDQ